MPRRLPEPDYGLVWSALPEKDRATIEGWERLLRLEPGSWRDVAPIRQMALTIAAATLTLQWPEMPEGDALARAFEELGVEDDSERNSRPSDSHARLLREWRQPRKSFSDHAPAESATVLVDAEREPQ